MSSSKYMIRKTLYIGRLIKVAKRNEFALSHSMTSENTYHDLPTRFRMAVAIDEEYESAPSNLLIWLVIRMLRKHWAVPDSTALLYLQPLEHPRGFSQRHPEAQPARRVLSLRRRLETLLEIANRPATWTAPLFQRAFLTHTRSPELAGTNNSRRGRPRLLLESIGTREHS
jgi:hypothetical protein